MLNPRAGVGEVRQLKECLHLERVTVQLVFDDKRTFQMGLGGIKVAKHTVESTNVVVNGSNPRSDRGDATARTPSAQSWDRRSRRNGA
jgi:hypothetical protein